LACSAEQKAPDYVNVELPSDATNVVTTEDEYSREVAFEILRQPKDASIIESLERKFRQAGKTRCDAGDEWQPFKDNGPGTTRRLVRFLRGNEPGSLTTLAVTEHCVPGSKPCRQVIVVKQSFFPSEMGDREQLITKICTGQE
jgi:hypothetical protein